MDSDWPARIWGDDVMTVLMGTMDITKMRDALVIADAVVSMKIGRRHKKIAGLLEETGLASRAYIVAMPRWQMRQFTDCQTIAKTDCYFSIIVIHGQGRRP